ncbi:MAG: hypothetical protein H6711_34190 [Myxococcales bacterium]|nr:hypothetical protein [Myxococcales bacterium]
MSSDDRVPAVRTKSPRPGLVTWMFGLDHPTLTDLPQRWGVLPTLRFWNRLDTAKYQAIPIAVGVIAAIGLFKLVAPILFPLLGSVLGMVVLIPMAIVIGILPLGLFERWLRREIASRRALPESTG